MSSKMAAMDINSCQLVKLDLIICSSVDKINSGCDNDQFQVRVVFFSSIPQTEAGTLLQSDGRKRSIS